MLFSDLEWKIIYVGSAESEEYDQTLDTVVVGPIIAGRHMFVFEVINGILCICVFKDLFVIDLVELYEYGKTSSFHSVCTDDISIFC